jgi:hypothetical protein
LDALILLASEKSVLASPMFLRSIPRQRRLICRLVRPVADFAPSTSFFGLGKAEEIDLDQFAGREAVISNAGIRRRESHP